MGLGLRGENYITGLSEFKRTLISEIYSLYTEWHQFSKELEYDNIKYMYQAPNRTEEDDFLQMLIESNNEVIIGFDGLHTHFYRNCYDNGNEFLQEIISFIEDILSERIVVATTFQHDKGLKYWEVIEATKISDFLHEIQHLRSWH